MSGSLEAFEDWDKKVKVNTWSGNMMERQERKWYRKQTWIAALKWIDEQCDKLDDSFILDCSCFRAVQRIIEEELNEK